MCILICITNTRYPDACWHIRISICFHEYFTLGKKHVGKGNINCPCTHVDQKKKKTSHICFNTNYPTEMKLVPIVHYGLIQFALKFFLSVRLYGGGSLPNFYFLNINPKIWQWSRKVYLSNCLEINFCYISNISLRVIRRRN